MDARKIRIRILNLQDKYCRKCEHHTGPHTHCMYHCEIGKEMYRLGMDLVPEEKNYAKQTQLEWDERCKQTLTLRKEGLTYKQIAQKLGCHASSLRTQLQKRGLSE
ncbi:hypothetical protein COC69_01265 [Bacillus cereus]|uniref:RNA polymerase sigma factor 70 region 4 type 2 domain-containing protein n=1 Tax=Bacillus cereus TaxID=1396 RepID=A0A9X7CT43_BACCE|nr:zinc-finger domain-containing protein [Bacillus cereus]PGS83970.1 hypothetical protein COC69_01265 [Bacillus cereus]